MNMDWTNKDEQERTNPEDHLGGRVARRLVIAGSFLFVQFVQFVSELFK